MRRRSFRPANRYTQRIARPEPFAPQLGTFTNHYIFILFLVSYIFVYRAMAVYRVIGKVRLASFGGLIGKIPARQNLAP